MAVIEKLEAKEGFTKTEELLADYVLAHADEVVLMSVSELAGRSYTSSGAINRLCRKVGTSGYREFRVALNTDLERRRAEKDVNADLVITSGESSTAVMAHVGNVFKKAIDSCFAETSAREVRDAARAIANADRVIMYGGGDSAISCEMFAADLARIGIAAIPAYRYGSLWSATRLARRGDVGLVVSYSGNAFESVAPHVRALHEAGCKTIAVSSKGRPQGVVVPPFDYYLKLSRGEDIMGSAGTFFSQMCVRYVLSCLYAVVYSLDSERNTEHRIAVTSPDWAR